MVIPMTDNEIRRDELLADIVSRQARRDAGEEPAEWQSPELTKPRPQPKRSNVVTEQPNWDAWNRWAESVVKNTLAGQPTFSKKQSDALAFAIHLMRKEWREHVATELGQLRADVAILRGIVTSNNVTSIKGDRDAA
jgi:hypothetical protein